VNNESGRVGNMLSINCGHRGASSEAPENTLAAFELAIRQGATMLELDVQLSLDGYPVVIHDVTVERTTNGSGKVSEMSLEALRALDAGAWFSEQYAGQRIPTLQEVIALARAQNIRLDVEMKFSRGSWYPLCDAVGALIDRLDFAGGCFVSSFNHRALHYFKTRFLHIPIARLYATRAPRERNLRFASPPCAAVFRLLVVPSLVKRIHRLGGEISVWTVDDPDEMGRFIRMGVDVIITNRPAVLQSVLDRFASETEPLVPIDEDD